jgi:[ribosomal protein S18]-alanine N-acetyltransferase
VTRRIELLTPTAARALAAPLSRLHRAAFAADPWGPKAISELTVLAGFFGLIAWEDALPVGFALAFGLGEECEIIALGVVPKRRRAGIGAALLDALCSEVRRRGARGIVLEVAADNAAARSLYAAHGFVRAGSRRDYYRLAGRAVDAEVLRLTLAAPSPSI